ncbi:hypothetical protein Y032_0093g2625 [Ancylostoma ceylanicum]|uniref:Zinc finger, C4 type n=1 Tax=Ancylostoma ceylanicum TaxID=53326 RepID=A0A016TLH7_9BILA|nr:hypothetical protein Y032_0093g2625 [Ancylostoma ceylanicum]
MHISAGRNVCRSCRFQKCLDVGMEPDAIRPDRDKTGRQKNPRRNGSHLINGLDPAVVKKLSGASMLGDLPCVNKRDDSDENPTSPSSRAESAPAVDIRPSPCDEILTTLREIEQICLQLRDVAPVSPLARPTLLDCVHRPSLITPRSQLLFDGSKGPGSLTTIAENVRRMIVLVFDYANTLKPIADILPEEKIALIRNCITPFALLMLSFYSSKSDSDAVYLPSGHTLPSDMSLFSSVLDDDKRHLLMIAKCEAVRRGLVDQVINQLRKLHVTETELLALKAIMALDPNVKGLSMKSSGHLLVGRESVQNALFAHLMTRHPASEATARFGHLLLLIASVTEEREVTSGGPGVEPVRKSLSEGRSTNDSVSGASSTGWTDVFKAVKNVRFASSLMSVLDFRGGMLVYSRAYGIPHFRRSFCPHQVVCPEELPQPLHGCLHLEKVNLFGRNLYNLACALKFSTVLKRKPESSFLKKCSHLMEFPLRERLLSSWSLTSEDGGVAKMCEALRNLDLIK